jgi:hypothetical protein
MTSEKKRKEKCSDVLTEDKMSFNPMLLYRSLEDMEGKTRDRLLQFFFDVIKRNDFSETPKVKPYRKTNSLSFLWKETFEHG